MEAGDADSNLGTVELLDKNDPAKADIHFANAMKHYQIALRAKPGDADTLSEIADGYAWLADSQLALGHNDEACANRLRQTQLLSALQAKDPKNAEYAGDFLGNALGLARIELAQGQATQADKRLTAALADAKRLSAADPDDKTLLRQIVAIGLHLAKAKLAEGNPNIRLVETLLANCRTSIAKDDRELDQLCAAQLLRLDTIEGHQHRTPLDTLHRDPNRIGNIRSDP
jgi:hypothetical protein